MWQLPLLLNPNTHADQSTVTKYSAPKQPLCFQITSALTLATQPESATLTLVCPMAAEHISEHIQQHALLIEDVSRWWLLQANINMNLLIARKLLGRDASADKAPIILDNYANTASAGSLIAFNNIMKI